MLSICVYLEIIYCHVILLKTISEVEFKALLYLYMLRVKTIALDTDNIFNMRTSLSYDAFKIVRDRSPLLRSLFLAFWRRVTTIQ